MKSLGFAGAMALAAFTLSGPAAAAVIETFDNPVAVSPTQAAGTWYTDRYAPADFTAGVAFDGRQVLEVDISPSDSANNRPGGFGGAFYNTQGRKFDLDPGTTSMSIELYVDDAWAGSGKRMAGFWGTGFDNSNAVAAFPILEYTEGDGPGRFRGYEVTTGNWLDLGLPSGFAYDSWYTLGITLSGGMFTYTVGNLSVSTDAGDATSIGNVILQGHNTTTGVEYAIHWDNLATGAAVPEPSSWALMILGFGAAGAALRRRTRALAGA